MSNIKTTALTWSAKKLSVSELKIWKQNPRKISKESFEKLKERIVERGFHDVIKVDTDFTILSGNQRKSALLDLKMEEVLVLIPSRPLTEDERSKVALESNHNDGIWDYELLEQNFELDLLTDIGFDEDELNEIWSEDLEAEDDEFDEKEELSKIKSTDIKRGDMFKLGRHTLLCEDALDPNTAKRLMGGKKADLVNDDLPYNIDLSYNSGVGNKSSYGGTTNDSKTDKEYEQFVRTVMQNAMSVSNPDCHYMFWCDERYVWLFQILYKELGIDSKRLLIWLKDNASPTPNQAFNKVTEYCVYGTFGRPYLNRSINNLNEVVNKNMSTGKQLFEDVLDNINVWMTKRLPSKEYAHPTQKNPSLHDKALRRCTKPGDIVLDLTAGSGSILSACEQLNRTAYVSEYEPVFCQLIINRFEAQTGIKAKLIREHEEG